MRDYGNQLNEVIARILSVAPDFRVSGLNFDSLADLSVSADRTFVSAAYRLDSLVQSNLRVRNALSDINATIRALGLREKELESALATSNSNEVRAAKEKLKTVQGWETAWDARTRIMNSMTGEFRRRSDVAAENIVRWITVASPPEARTLPANLLAGRKKAAFEPKPVMPAPAAVVPSKPIIPAQAIRMPAFRGNPPGNLNNKIAAIEQLIPALAKARANAGDLGREKARKGLALENLRIRVDALESAGRSKSALLTALERQIEKADDAWSTAAMDGHRQGRNLLNAAIETYVLETFLNDVVKPKVTEFIRDNGYTRLLENSAIGEMYRSGQFLFNSTKQRYQSLERMIDVAKQAKDVVDDFKSYATAAAAASASPNNVAAANLIREQEGLLDRQTWSLMEAAVGKTGPLAQVARKILTR
ncbi:MAG: hypothetical protein COW30_04745 [Rhodospirillales bacterium CG15_BIG_FIL_POST_REV_8_21_14_020_66_15]|nr:MAG: hypothetical protein COW30_04745 [Rhodospirillales bacterium CG15_BIG_FIL_POST_REV_8_21_14_020_66_15]